LAVLDAMVLPRYLAAKAKPAVVVPARKEIAPAPIPPGPSLPAPPASAVAEIPEIPTAETPEALPPLLFWRNASVLTKDAQRTLTRLLELMTTQPALQVRLSGHTDDLGPLPVNRLLSSQRARAARAWLVDRGIDQTRIEVQGLGAVAPVDGVIVPSARPQNRRVEIEFR
jgi:outer membrane protein OmpA-like peptidoglycan-associated protein